MVRPIHSVKSLRILALAILSTSFLLRTNMIQSVSGFCTPVISTTTKRSPFMLTPPKSLGMPSPYTAIIKSDSTLRGKTTHLLNGASVAAATDMATSLVTGSVAATSTNAETTLALMFIFCPAVPVCAVLTFMAGFLIVARIVGKAVSNILVRLGTWFAKRIGPYWERVDTKALLDTTQATIKTRYRETKVWFSKCVVPYYERVGAKALVDTMRETTYPMYREVICRLYTLMFYVSYAYYTVEMPLRWFIERIQNVVRPLTSRLMVSKGLCGRTVRFLNSPVFGSDLEPYVFNIGVDSDGSERSDDSEAGSAVGQVIFVGQVILPRTTVFQTAVKAPVLEELSYRYLPWIMFGRLLKVPYWPNVANLLFGLMHVGNHVPVWPKGNNSPEDKFKAYELAVLVGIGHASNAYLLAELALMPLFLKYGIWASITFHAAWNFLFTMLSMILSTDKAQDPIQDEVNENHDEI